MRRLISLSRRFFYLYFLLIVYSSVAQNVNNVVIVSCQKPTVNSSTQEENCFYDTILINDGQLIYSKETRVGKETVFEQEGRFFQVVKSCERRKSSESSYITECKYDTVEISETKYLLLTKRLSIPDSVQVECKKPKQGQEPHPNCYVILADGSKVPIKEYIKATIKEKQK